MANVFATILGKSRAKVRGIAAATIAPSKTQPSAQPSAIADLFRLFAGETAILVAGFTTAQACAFLRNVVFAQVLSRGDFGIAATILLLLHILEWVTDIRTDRLAAQSGSGGYRRTLGTAQTIQVLRALTVASLLFFAAGPLAQLLQIPEAVPAIVAISFAALVKGFTNVDIRRSRRVLDNRPAAMIEATPQVLALLATPIALQIAPTFEAVVIVVLLQAGASVAMSHILATTPFTLAWHRETAHRLVVVAFPLWICALPLVAVYQADRLLIGAMIGMEAVAGYTVAFLVTMLPGLVAARLGPTVILRLFYEARDNQVVFTARIRSLAFGAGLFAVVYVLVFAALGGPFVGLAFGSQYAGLGFVVTLLAAMWAARMVQTVFLMALMSQANGWAVFEAGLIRASGLIAAAIMIAHGFGIAGVAAAALVSELAALAFAVWRTHRVVATPQPQL